MDQLPAIPQGLPVFWGTMFALANIAVSLFCGFVVPAILKLRKDKREGKEYEDGRADKGYQYVIAQQKADKEALIATVDEKDAELKTVNEKFTESVRLAERFKTQYENADIEIKRLRDLTQQQTIEITELKAAVKRLQDHEARTQQQIEMNNTQTEELKAKLFPPQP